MLSGVRMKPVDEVLASPIVQQTAFWSEVKKNLGVGTGAYAFKLPKSDVAGCSGQSGSQEADVLVVQQQLDAQHSIAYVPYGPEIEPVDGMHGPFLEELSESLRAYLPSSCIALRYDLCWESFWSGEEDFYDERGQWQGPPDAPVQEMRFNFGTQNWGFKKAQSNLLPSNTVFLNLLQSEAALLAGMKSKTRYNIRLAARKGVVVDELGMDQLDLWYALYSETARRNGIYLHELEYFRAVLEARKSRNAQPTEVILLLARRDELPLAAMFLVVSGSRATYLYGASATENKALMGSYALQWAAVQKAKRMGCSEYDMFGVAPNADPEHPMYGLYRFKTGFGGRLYHRMGSWDYPIQDEAYTYFSAMEMTSRGYHL